MKRFSLVMVVLLFAVPALADVKIIAEQDPQDPMKALIKYEVTGEPNLVRAFALDITCAEANIIEVNDFVPGDNLGNYGIYPSSFDAEVTVNPDGTVSPGEWDPPYSPEADPADDGTQPGLGTGGLTVEMGSLYTDTPPGLTGLLCSVKVDGSGTVCVALNAARGEVVMENAAPPVGNVILGEDACVELGDVCPCMGDIAGGDPGGEGPDTFNDALDMGKLMMHLFFNGGTSPNGWTADNPIPADLLCMNVDETPSTVPAWDGQQVLDALDMSAFMMHLFFNGGTSANGWRADFCYGSQ